MQVKDLQPKQSKVDIVVEVISKDEPREFEKFGRQGKVCNAMAKDETGQIKLSLWNDQVDQVNVGNKVHFTNGYVSEWQGEKQLGTGKFGQLEVVEGGSAPSTPETNEEPKTPSKPAPAADTPAKEAQEPSSEPGEEPISVTEEELVE